MLAVSLFSLSLGAVSNRDLSDRRRHKTSARESGKVGVSHDANAAVRDDFASKKFTSIVKTALERAANLSSSFNKKINVNDDVITGPPLGPTLGPLSTRT